MSGSSSNPAVKEKWIAGLLKGWRKRIVRRFSFFVVEDRKVRTKAVEKAFAAVSPAAKRVEDLRIELRKAIRERDRRLLAVERLATHAEAFVRLTHGDNAEALRDYDLQPRKQPAPRSSLQKAITVQKRMRTRKLRGTMGRRQRLKAAEPKISLLAPEEPAPAPATERVTVTAEPPKPEEPIRLLAAPGDEEPK